MKAHIFYKHQTGNSVYLSLTRQADTDPVYISFTPENGEETPFPEGLNPLPYALLVQWAQEHAAMETALNTLGVETQEEEEANA